MENTKDFNMQAEDIDHVMEYEGLDCVVEDDDMKCVMGYEELNCVVEDDRLVNPSLIIIDWDDTLFPTNIVCDEYSWVTQGKQYISEMIPISARNDLIAITNELDEKLTKIIDKMMKFAEVVIITNSSPSWIELWLNEYLPFTKRMFELYNIKVVHARFHKKDNYKLNSNEWKMDAFNDVIMEWIKKNNYENVMKNVFSIGDKMNDLKALDNFEYNMLIKKGVKFIENPSYPELKNELDLLNSVIDGMVVSDKNLLWYYNKNLDYSSIMRNNEQSGRDNNDICYVV